MSVKKTSTRIQNREAVELIRALKAKLLCQTDRELAEYLDLHPSNISKWRQQGLPKAVSTLIQLHLEQYNPVTVDLIERLKKQLQCDSEGELASILGLKESQINSWKYKKFPQSMVEILDKILPSADSEEWDSLSYEDYFQDKACVYFVQSEGNNLIKIGYTTNLKKRLAKMRTDSSTPLKVLFAMEAYRLEEKSIHSGLFKFNIHGEWFAPSAELLEYIEEQKFEYRLS